MGDDNDNNNISFLNVVVIRIIRNMWVSQPFLYNGLHFASAQFLEDLVTSSPQLASSFMEIDSMSFCMVLFV